MSFEFIFNAAAGNCATICDDSKLLLADKEAAIFDICFTDAVILAVPVKEAKTCVAPIILADSVDVPDRDARRAC